MGKFTKLGATALVMAVSVSMFAPLGANAQIIKNYDAATKTYNYVNEDTNEIITFKDGKGEMKHEGILYNEKKVYYINVKRYMEIAAIYTTPDVAKFTDFETNSKKLKLRMYDKTETTNTGSARYAYSKKEGGVEKFYYKDVNGNWQSATAKELDGICKGTGRYKLQFYAKEAGKYKVTYNARNAEGAIVANKTITIIARDDIRPIKSITYGGKNVLTDTDGDGRDDYINYYAKTGNYTKKKKGKLVVTANKGYKIKKLEISSSVVVTRNVDDEDWTGTRNSDSEARDLNGNGRTDDIVNDQDESNVQRVWTPIKNKKTLKLSKILKEEADNYNLVSKKNSSKTKIRTAHGVVRPTYLRVTYYDTKNHRTLREEYEINLFKK